MKYYFPLIVILVFLIFGLSACGADGPSTTKNVSMLDFQFSPNTFTVPAGQEITINASNNGAVVHDLVIMKLGTTAGDSFGDEDTLNIYWKVELQPGQGTSATFMAPSQPGEYQVVCGTKGHLSAGMLANLIVVAQ